MDTVLGLFGVVAYILGVLTLAASVTYLVVKLSPARDRPKDAKS